MGAQRRWRAPHPILKPKTKNQVAAEYRGGIRWIENRDCLDLLAECAVERTIIAGKILFESADFIAPELAEHVGEKVWAFPSPDADMGKLYIFLPERAGGRKFLCIAENPERSGIDRNVAALMSRQAQQRKMAEDRRATRRVVKRIKPSTLADVIAERARQQAPSREALFFKVAHETDALRAAGDAFNPAVPVEEDPSNTPDALLVVADSGWGKSTAAAAAVEQYKALLIRVPELVTPVSLLTEILRALLGWSPDEKRAYDLYLRCIEELLRKRDEDGSPVVIILDEADRLDRSGRRNLMQLCRDLSDQGGAVIVFVSVKRLATRLAKPDVYDETICTRLATDTIRFARPSLADAQKLADELLDVVLDSDVVASALAASDHSIRPLMAAFAEIERVATAAKVDRLSLARWEELKATAGAATARKTTSRTRLSAETREAVIEAGCFRVA
jgi:predicted kinase